MPVLGMLLGLFYKKNSFQWEFNEYSNQNWIFGFFATLGLFAGSKGYISEQDIKFAENLMSIWNYSIKEKKQAIQAFRMGRNLDVNNLASQLKAIPYWLFYREKMLFFINEYLKHQTLHPKQIELWEFWVRLFRENNFNNYHSSKTNHSSDLSWAYNILGASARDDFKVVKNKFRKLISKYHPDRSDDPKAKEKSQDIQKAYAMLKQAKGWV